jgi:hypothetical protein
MRTPARKDSRREPALFVGTALFGLFYSKLVAFGCWLAAGQPDSGLETMRRHWLDFSGLLPLLFFNLLELQPFVVLAVVELAICRVRCPRLRWGVRAGAWLGALGTALWLYRWYWTAVFGGANGSATLVYLMSPSLGAAGAVGGAVVGCVVGLLLRDDV